MWNIGRLLVSLFMETREAELRKRTALVGGTPRRDDVRCGSGEQNVCAR
jgi:hypothetical protein